MARLRALKDRVPIAARDWLRDARRGNPYRYERAPAPVRIGDVVSPLRYDVLVRARHFEFHAQHRARYAEDFAAYERAARETAYRVWFTRVMAPRWLPGVSGEALERAWAQRLHDSAALHASFERHGFDTNHPIELHAGVRVRPTPSGKSLARRLYAGDGNHRLALLMCAGRQELSPSEYRVRRYLSLVPADTTGFLVGELGTSWSDYRAFVELGYPDVTLHLEDGRVHARGPRAAEAETVARIDWA